MTRTVRTARLFLIYAIPLALAGGAAAQQAPPRPAPPVQHGVKRPVAEPQQTVQAQPPAPGDSPQSTTATYDDWIMQCQTQAGPPAEKVCDMAQVTQVQVQGKSQPFTRVVVTHPVKGQPVKLIVQVPVNASFATNVRIQIGDADPGFTTPFARCTPAGCFAEFEIKDDILKKLLAATGAGKLSFADAGGHDLSVPVSFKGFSQAYEALAKQ